jgi:geranylgeranyl transferase type-2 subunit alpha
MHGVKKEARSEARVAEDALRIAEFRTALERAEAARRQLQQATEEEPRRTAAAATLAASEGVLLLNPSHYTMWNVRKEALEALGRDQETLPAELKLTARCLQLNPKAYCVWEHRRFCLEPLLTPQLAAQEMALCDK